jgi:hypothetical protein
MGSTRWELTPEQRSIWVDLLARASINQVPGRIEYFSLEQLSNQFQVNLALLEETLKRCKEVKKIKYYPKKNLILIRNWTKYQSEYERQKPYREQDRERAKDTKKADNSCEKVTLRGEGEERRIDLDKKEITDKNEKIEESESLVGIPTISPSPLASISKIPNEGRLTIKETFLSMLKSCRGYSFDEEKDSTLFDIIVTAYPKLNFIKQLEKKIDWWNLHPEALKANPREKLETWFKKEFEFQKQGGPQAIGSILKEIGNPDHRNWVKQLIGISNEQSKVNKA